MRYLDLFGILEKNKFVILKETIKKFDCLYALHGTSFPAT
jgi:hypothetical protein